MTFMRNPQIFPTEVKKSEVFPMYDKLIKRLRETSIDFGESDHVSVMMIEAANAIEELQAYVALYKDCGETAMKAASDYKARIEELQKQLREEKVDNVNLTGWLAEEHAKHRWIPVAERLPECDLGAEVGNIEWIICGMVHAGCFGRGGRYRDAYFRTWTDAKEGIDAKEADYWRAVTFPQPPEDG